MNVLTSIPSPGFNAFGPLRLYGLMIALGVLAAVELARYRWRQRGGDPDDITTIAIWAVPAGLIGARLYHVITDWNRLYADRPLDAFKIQEGGLGIPGGIALGVIVGVIVARSKGIRLGPGLDAVAPALPLAQAIGRLGNWFNQELYGRPTDLPWGLRIDPEHRSAGYELFTTFHPTFLYEMLWNLALVGVLIWLDNRRVLRPGRIFVVYVGGYFLGRLWVESLRIDTATELWGLRVNTVMSLVGIAAAAIILVAGGLKHRDDDNDDLYTEARLAVSKPGNPTDDPNRST